jgi:hypothetical protein
MSYPKQEILQDLITKARNPEIGLAAVRDACNAFLRLRMKAINEPSKVEVSYQTKKTWTRQLWLAQGGVCKRCHKAMMLAEATLDRVQPGALGGHYEKKNCQAVHGKCNSSKNDNDWLTESKATGDLATVQEEHAD